MLLLVDEQVVNFEMPRSVAGYVHRIGRTGRAYSSGASISLVSLLNKQSSSLPPSKFQNELLLVRFFAYLKISVFWVYCGDPRWH